ncbi:TetR/AcrR family transcriptional regulator [Parasulfuritortus cantonensis]|uniref:TetR/AcrR family transcriptional regulator n=1 Tax=Parasulfuritortus cantonensis TaxID=2528202 RepID=A0A4R1B4S3_9PROT|nr:TetR/AcrR family transcriptional regulator [Parasulfuritortus cantonensis]TCJ12941.1 TetR/AcrR family transcriptional regulator [Parasulfuritortus cantonensis]
MNPETRPPRWQRRAEARPQEVLEAALAVFVERGYASARLDEVARRAGVAKATLYLYYANKLELFKAVVRHALVDNLDEVARLQAAAGARPGREQLTFLLHAFMRRVAGSPLSGIPKLVMAEAGNFPELARFYHDEVIARGRAIICGTLARGIAAGEFRAVDVDYAWRVVIGPALLAIIWKHSFLAFEDRGMDFERHLAVHLDMLFNGLAAPDQKGTRDEP